MLKLVQAALRETQKVFDFNRAHANELELGFDGQISNWAIVGFDAEAQRLPDEIRLVYLDTSTPLMRKGGREQLNPELFLRSAPFFLAWLLRLLYLDEVLTRYYDFRRVALDLVANFYKEQRADLIPALIDLVNDVVRRAGRSTQAVDGARSGRVLQTGRAVVERLPRRAQSRSVSAPLDRQGISVHLAGKDQALKHGDPRLDHHLTPAACSPAD